MNNKQILETFWATMATNDFHAAAGLLHDDHTLEWPQSGERIRGREHFALINTHYPAEGLWRFTIHSMVVEHDVVVTDVSVTDAKRQDRAITFSTIRDGKIWKQVEFWPEPFEAPAWRAGWVEKL
ncbi:MAG TPA: nuclear transport factor 2 family protein [Anaerolineales bacterium]|nr:nuclear transport factor 2 family protein [Anaerolineales bacterium]